MNWFNRLFQKKELRTIAPGRFLYPVNSLNNSIYPSWSAYDNVHKAVTSVDVYSVISRIAETTAAVPLLTYKKTPDKKAFKQYINKGLFDPLKKLYGLKALEVLPETDPLNELLTNPGNGLTQREFVQLVCFFYLSAGEAFAYKYSTGPERGSKTLALHLFPPQDVILRVTDTFPYEIVDYQLSYNGRVILTAPAKDVIHWKIPNPCYGYNGEHLRGLSPLQVGKDLTESIDLGEQRRKATVKNGSLPGIIFLEEGVDAPDYNQWREQYQKFMENPDNNGAPMPVNGKVGLLQTGLKALDMQLMENVNLNFQKLCNLYKVSDLLFNSPTRGTFNNTEEMKKDLYTSACIPLADAIAEGFRKGLITDNSKFINFDFSGVQVLQQDMVKMMQSVAEMPVSLTGNQIYELFGYERVDMPEMDKPLLKQGYSFIDDNIVLPSIDENI